MLRGRQVECATIDSLVDRMRHGTSAALLLRGEPGIGKTALLDYAAEIARSDIRVLRCVGIESEAQVPYAGLHLALRPVLDRLPTLAEPLRKALSGAFGHGTAAGDRFMVGAAVLSLLSAAAERVPLLLLLDDAHWLDRASLDACVFAARRLDREAVGVLVATRNQAGAPPATGLPELDLRGLDAAEAALLLADLGQPDGTGTELVSSTEGNPLALRELAASDRGPSPGPLPLTDRLLQAFGQQLEEMPPSTPTFLALAAAEDTGDLAIIHRAAPAVGTAIADLAPAEDAGLVRVVDRTVFFRHPLLRSAAYQRASMADRIVAHRALAAVTGNEDRRAWHRAATTIGTDDQVAAELEQAADRAVARGAHGAAASGYARAADLSAVPSERLRRRTLASESAASAGRTGWAKQTALDGLAETEDPLLRGRLLEVAGRADFAARNLPDAHTNLLAAGDAMAEHDPDRAFWTVLTALHTVWPLPDDPAMFAAPIDRLDLLAADAPGLQPVAWLAKWAAAVGLQGDTDGFPAVDPLIAPVRAAARERGPETLSEVMGFLFMVAQDEASAEVAAELVRLTREHSRIAALPPGLAHLCLTQVVLGRHRDAVVTGSEAVTLAEDTGEAMWAQYADAALAYLAATEGDEQRCHDHARRSGVQPDGPLTDGNSWARVALGLLDLGLGRVTEAYRRLDGVQRGPARHLSSVVRSVPDFVEAAVRIGNMSEATEATHRYRTWSASTGQPWSAAIELRCRALLATDGTAGELYRQALQRHPDDQRPFERARTALLYGEWLRRERRRSDAQRQLETARQLFDSIDARPWVERAGAELAAAGAPTVDRGSGGRTTSLTPQEQQIVGLAAAGRSNQEIATQLFLSPRTVAYHLYKAYPKLGVRSRSELADVLAESS